MNGLDKDVAIAFRTFRAVKQLTWKDRLWMRQLRVLAPDRFLAMFPLVHENMLHLAAVPAADQLKDAFVAGLLEGVRRGLSRAPADRADFVTAAETFRRRLIQEGIEIDASPAWFPEIRGR